MSTRPSPFTSMRQVAEIVDVVVGVVDLAKVVLGPLRAFVPVFAGDDVGLAVAIDVGDRGGLARARIDHLPLEQDVVGAGGGPADDARRR